MDNGRGNLAACNAGQLAAIMKNRLKRIQHRPGLIGGSSLRPDSASNPDPRGPRPWPSRLLQRPAVTTSLSCHGIQHPADAALSAGLLHDQPLTRLPEVTSGCWTRRSTWLEPCS